ncbi:MAG: hypothetical protein MK236_06275 [Pedosphaera sp.]|nr:hypothetical protein [Pedosphaera sp.]
METHAEGAMDPQLKPIEFLSALNKELENLAEVESEEDFMAEWTGLKTLLLSGKETVK